MHIQLQISVNDKLYLRDPEQTELGRNIISHSIELIHKNGFEAFTFKKLAKSIGTTEAGVYRYFENKHRLLLYLTSWYWSWLKFMLSFEINNISDPLVRLKKVIRLLATAVKDDERTSYVRENLLHQIIIAEGSKAYLTKHVTEDNKDQFFKPYKELCGIVSEIILDYSPGYAYPRSLSSTIIEIAHLQNYFMHHLPSLTDFGKSRDENRIIAFIEDLVFKSLDKKRKS